jgi:hypothetical protein
VDQVRENFDLFRHLLPQTRVVVKDPVSVMRALVEAGYKVNESGDWTLDRDHHTFIPTMWYYCGKGPIKFAWEPEWLEEVEW